MIIQIVTLISLNYIVTIILQARSDQAMTHLRFELGRKQTNNSQV